MIENVSIGIGSVWTTKLFSEDFKTRHYPLLYDVQLIDDVGAKENSFYSSRKGNQFTLSTYP